MRPVHAILLATLAFAACEAPTEPPEASPDLQPSFTKMAPISDVLLTDSRFKASVFYDGIEGPDGIFPRTNSQLFVVKEYRGGEGVYLAKKGRAYDVRDAFSTLGDPFVSPDDVTVGPDGTVYVADGQAQTVFRIARGGGLPQAMVTEVTTRPGFNPFGVIVAPATFAGPNVDPGDLLVTDNSYGSLGRAVWAVNPATGIARIIAEGSVFNDGPIDMAFAGDGTLFVAENTFTGALRIVTLSPDGVVVPVYLDTGQRSEIAINPITDEIFFVKDDGDIYRMHVGGPATLFASGLGGTQDIVFNDAGTMLFVSTRVRQQVVQIHAVRKVWLKH